ncbi:hypothetical protein [uncultured Veillonella sp.]|uniref:hypothetical protein n=1 Tax=uncultured Veillonella sp. TaxID=159268 RepID=UPI002599E5E7|nr:hypothetical protein [uncultured Veillonella sp.]
MKRIYLLSLWLLACLVLPIKGQAVTQADLLNSERFGHIDSSADSGRGDGKYLDLSSVKSVTAPNGHRRIEASIYVSMPAANMIQGLSVQYDYQMDRSLRHLINAHDQALKQGNKIPYISIWRAKQGNSGITGTVNDGGTYYNDGQIRQQRVYKENLNAMILPADFGDEKYKLPNLLYQKAYGIAYDDET